VAELGHAREQVVLDLVVQEGHPPIDAAQRARGDIHGVDRRIPNPVHLLQWSD
jgi:hypothetical protein